MKAPLIHWLDPITRKRFRRFHAMRRAWWSLMILLALFVLSMGAELIANSRPLLLRYRGHWFFPVFFHYTERAIRGEGGDSPADYKAIAKSEAFLTSPGRFVLFPPIPYGPDDIVAAPDLPVRPEIEVTLAPDPAVASVRLNAELNVTAEQGLATLGITNAVIGQPVAAWLEVPAGLGEAVKTRLSNTAAKSLSLPTRLASGQPILCELASYHPQPQALAGVLLVVRENPPAVPSSVGFVFSREGACTGGDTAAFQSRSPEVQNHLKQLVARRLKDFAEPVVFVDGGLRWRASADKEDARFPFRPCAGHPFGLDSAGRDVFARVLYGTRISLLFGMGLSLTAMVLGTMLGGMQGFFGGRVDLAGQRLTEIWGALPFLYIMILAGDVFGRSIAVLFGCYSLLNWIGISYYMRAEFLRLRRLPFVDAARGLGLSAWTIMRRHILPNALVPIITFFPFSLVGAIGSLTALDFLGFGLPPPTPSWGELLAQSHEVKWAWWLVLYPSAALFVVMLLSVFIGEGLRAAFDPKKFARIE